MVNTIDMQDMRRINLFGKITRISTRFCFSYNETIFFCVPQKFLSKAIGGKGENVQEMKKILRKRVKIIATPRGIEDAQKFISSVVDPITFKELSINDKEIILTAGSQNKAALLGRNKRRFLEMQKIVGDFFNREYKII